MDLFLKDSGDTRWGRPVMELTRSLTYRFDHLSNEVESVKVVVRVPKGFKTDFASVPRILWPIVSPTGPWRAAAVIHDYCCEQRIPRPLTDAIFWTVMVEDVRIKSWQRHLIYGAVRAYWVLFGKWTQKR